MTMPRPASVLVVDDEPRALETLRRTLEDDFEIFTAGSGAEGLQLLEQECVQIVVSDQRMPGMSGVEFLRSVRARWPDTIRMILSGYTESEDIIRGINEAGIWQYLLKPWRPDQLLLTLQGAAQLWRLQQENQRLTLELRASPEQLSLRVATLRQKARAQAGFDGLTRAPDSPLNAVCTLAAKVAGHDLAVLVTGESGTGKEVLARAIHYASARAEGPFVVENCGALPDTLLESELFGHRKGAFTGATESRTGLFQQADGGTLFLDEIGDTSPAFQVKLLRALQEGEIRPLGSPRPVAVDVRLIAATHRDLEADVAAGRFRADLYYRIAGMTLHLPPLRSRPQDVAPIAEAILRAHAPAEARLSPQALACLRAYPWPGNVRELQNEVRRALALAEGPMLGAELFTQRVREAGGTFPVVSPGDAPPGILRQHVASVEAQLIRDAMERHHGNKTRVAGELGLTRVGLRMKLAKLGLTEP
ncbi:MAG TPA: sigma-54 dependent transcriptional regulator [Ramlibacter sp.]|uniref:sigma-54-dependent transcriptional regulator n=1 Tax=Ramlibacter sp. TaxID=1917967 RepID=UPI002D8075E9|nr:sigma-54 dependent transcriptional regulator [Ramlibacter sp.]HET8746510.1 sigma-54 dependent transcriptional regulator [Ramlibacter sp.]